MPSAADPALQAIGCSTSAAIDVIEQTTTAGSSSLRYDAATDTYTYIWKTERSWAGSCRQLILRFGEGTEKTATFKFSR